MGKKDKVQSKGTKISKKAGKAAEKQYQKDLKASKKAANKVNKQVDQEVAQLQSQTPFPGYRGDPLTPEQIEEMEASGIHVGETWTDAREERPDADSSE